MSFVITGTDTAGALRLKRETAAAAVKKARELAADGVVEIAITDPHGETHRPDAFDALLAAEASA